MALHVDDPARRPREESLRRLDHPVPLGLVLHEASHLPCNCGRGQARRFVRVLRSLLGLGVVPHPLRVAERRNHAHLAPLLRGRLLAIGLRRLVEGGGLRVVHLERLAQQPHPVAAPVQVAAVRCRLPPVRPTVRLTHEHVVPVELRLQAAAQRQGLDGLVLRVDVQVVADGAGLGVQRPVNVRHAGDLHGPVDRRDDRERRLDVLAAVAQLAAQGVDHAAQRPPLVQVAVRRLERHLPRPCRRREQRVDVLDRAALHRLPLE